MKYKLEGKFIKKINLTKFLVPALLLKLDVEQGKIYLSNKKIGKCKIDKEDILDIDSNLKIEKDVIYEIHFIHKTFVGSLKKIEDDDLEEKDDQDKNIFLEGEIIKNLPNNEFKVKLNNGHEIQAHLGGGYRIKPSECDIVKLEMSPYDLSRGRIISNY